MAETQLLFLLFIWSRMYSQTHIHNIHIRIYYYRYSLLVYLKFDLDLVISTIDKRYQIQLQLVGNIATPPPLLETKRGELEDKRSNWQNAARFYFGNARISVCSVCTVSFYFKLIISLTPDYK